jgi:hypothetical protein
MEKAKRAAKDTAPEAEIRAQIDTNEQDARATGNLKAEQPIREEVPDDATLVRGYWKWTDNDGNLHKVPIDGTTAIREPAHEQNELTIEDRDRLYQTLALKTPRRNEQEAGKIHDLEPEVRNSEVHNTLAKESPVKPASREEGLVTDGEEFKNAKQEVKVGTPAGEAE